MIIIMKEVIFKLYHRHICFADAVVNFFVDAVVFFLQIFEKSLTMMAL